MTWTGAHNDACKIGTAGNPSGPSPTVTYTWGPAINCRYSRVSTKEVPDGSQAQITDAEIRVPADTSVTTASRIHLTKLQGMALQSDATNAAAHVFEVVGEPFSTGLSDEAEIVLKVKRLNPNSAR